APQLTAAIPNLRRYAQSLTRSRADSDDLLQDTLERAMRNQHLYVADGPLLRWLVTIMRNLFISRMRRLGREVAIESLGARHRLAVPPNQADHQFIGELRDLIRRLPSDAQQVLISVAVHGEGYEAVANRLGIPVGTVRSRLSRSRRALAVAALGPAPERTSAAVPRRLCLSDEGPSRVAML